LGLQTIDGLRLVTVHPETNSKQPEAPLDAVMAALEAMPGPTVFTAPNSDPGGTEFRRRIERFVAANRWAVFRDTLGRDLYPNVMRHAAIMVGNSSSGIIEAGCFGLPVINVGRRQDGRERGANVFDCPNDEKQVRRTLEKLSRRASRFACGSPYGDGRSGPRIARILAHLLPRERLVNKVFLQKRATFSASWAVKRGRAKSR
jgi:UDP-N-acetylglucosamine 2-epimerase